MTVKAIMEALAEKLSEIDGVDALSYMPDQIDTGLAWPVVARTRYYLASESGLNEIDVMVMITTGRQSPQDAIERWYELMDPSVVVAKLAEDKTLGGACYDLIIGDSEPEQVQVGEEIYGAVMFRIMIMF